MARSFTVALLLYGALLAGCGGSGSGEGTKERFIAEGDRLCDSLGKRYARLVSTRITPTPAAALRNASEYRELARELSTGLAKIAMPSGAEPRRIVDLSKQLAVAARRQKVIAKRTVAAIQRRDPVAARRSGLAFNRGALRVKRGVADPLDRLLRAYGFKNCGRAA